MKTGEIKVIELFFVNVFLVKTDDGYILIDSGFSMQWEMLEKMLLVERVLPDQLKAILITHGDFDHTGNCKKLQEKYNCKIAMHPLDTPMATEGFIQNRKMKSFRAKFFKFLRKLKRRKFQIEKFTPDAQLIEGQDLKEYGINAKVLHIPGHTKGSVGILMEDGNFFAGDMFTNRKKPDTATYIENMMDLKASQLRLKSISIKTVYPGHGKPFDMKEILNKL